MPSHPQEDLTPNTQKITGWQGCGEWDASSLLVGIGGGVALWETDSSSESQTQSYHVL